MHFWYPAIPSVSQLNSNSSSINLVHRWRSWPCIAKRIAINSIEDIRFYRWKTTTTSINLVARWRQRAFLNSLLFLLQFHFQFSYSLSAQTVALLPQGLTLNESRISPDSHCKANSYIKLPLCIWCRVSLRICTFSGKKLSGRSIFHFIQISYNKT